MSLNLPLNQFLRSKGHNITDARCSVYDILADNEPLTMAELVSKCSSLMDRASVYRIIGLYEKLGVVQRLQIGWKYKIELSNTFQAHHHHLSCVRCGNVIVLSENNRLEKQLKSLADPYGYTMLDHQLEINGICPDCQLKL